MKTFAVIGFILLNTLLYAEKSPDPSGVFSLEIKNAQIEVQKGKSLDVTWKDGITLEIFLSDPKYLKLMKTETLLQNPSSYLTLLYYDMTTLQSLKIKSLGVKKIAANNITLSYEKVTVYDKEYKTKTSMIVGVFETPKGLEWWIMESSTGKAKAAEKMFLEIFKSMKPVK